ncbi:alpha/beta hydrolase [Catellatospora bangladeshensis]|uniref:Alpha/beta hydrolase n=1 Tax=Catellatospora bangladeshensis TaxID=310355 RepID=A0A8J3NIQ6_9ACTN|nr:alpha/beta fold hydrolase [Catellatospora bangladeshensis]GIF81103.1 alpha/beta hydrolase [Catellatospora bangladeshensis]
MTAPDTIVLIHGLWMTPLSWEHWIDRYTRQGYRVLAPSWPGLEGGVEALRRDPSPLAGLGVAQVADHYERIISDLPTRPIIMGHSFGGLLTQLMLDRGLGAAGVAIHSGQVRGVYRLPFTQLKAASPVLGNPANRNRAVPFTHEQFHYAFTNTLSAQRSREAYDRYHVPAAARMLFQGAFANLDPRSPLAVDVRRADRAPLLFVAGGADNIVPASVNRANHRLYRHSPALTEYREYPGRSHFTVGQDGWEEVADHALAWAAAHAR